MIYMHRTWTYDDEIDTTTSQKPTAIRPGGVGGMVPRRGNLRDQMILVNFEALIQKSMVYGPWAGP